MLAAIVVYPIRQVSFPIRKLGRGGGEERREGERREKKRKRKEKEEERDVLPSVGRWGLGIQCTATRSPGLVLV